MYIYKITNLVNNKVYIGQTRRDVSTRIREHINGAYHGTDFRIGAAIVKYGWDNFNVDILATAETIEDLNRLEHEYIQKYNSIECGYNVAPGGDSNVMDNPEIKVKHLASMQSSEVRCKISNSISTLIKDSGRTEEYVNNLRKGFEAYLRSDKFVQDCKKRKLSPEHYKALNDAKNKAVYCVDESGQMIAEFSRVKDAATWWYDQGYHVKDISQLMDAIKRSYTQNRFIRGLKWYYRV